MGERLEFASADDHLTLARRAWEDERHDDAYAHFARAAELAAAAGNRWAEARARRGLATAVRWSCPSEIDDPWAESVRQAEAALGIFRQLDDASEIAYCLRLIAPFAESREASVALLDEALASARRSGDEVAVAEMLGSFSAMTVASDNERAVRLANEALSIQRRRGDEPAIAESLMQLALASNDKRDRLAAFLEAIEIRRRISKPGGLGKTLLIAAMLAYDDDELDHREPLLAEALALYEKIDDRFFQATCLEQLADVAERRGDKSKADELRERAKSLSDDSSDVDVDAVLDGLPEWQTTWRRMGQDQSEA